MNLLKIEINRYSNTLFACKIMREIPKHEPKKKIYVEMVRQIVESETKNGEDIK